MDNKNNLELSRLKYIDELVSVIIPVYNAEKYLERTIMSINAQTYDNIEIIIVDDCSRDSSKSIIEKYERMGTNIKYYCQKTNAGAAVARNKALEIAQGRYVAFLDSDDVWKPCKIEKQLRLIKEKNAYFCFTAIEMIDGCDVIIKNKRKIKQVVNYDYLLHNTVIPTSSVVIDRQHYGDFRMPLRRGGQDYATWLLLLRDGSKAYGIDEALTQYRIDGKSLSSNKLKSIKQIWEIQTKNERLPVIRVIINELLFIINAFKKYFLK